VVVKHLNYRFCVVESNLFQGSGSRLSLIQSVVTFKKTYLAIKYYDNKTAKSLLYTSYKTFRVITEKIIGLKRLIIFSRIIGLKY